MPEEAQDELVVDIPETASSVDVVVEDSPAIEGLERGPRNLLKSTKNIVKKLSDESTGLRKKRGRRNGSNRRQLNMPGVCKRRIVSLGTVFRI